MGQPHPPPPRHQLQCRDEQSRLQPNSKLPPLRPDIGEADVDALIEENAELRRLVIQLSKLVLKNVVDRS